MKHMFTRRSVSQGEAYMRAAKRVRYLCPHCGKRFKDKAVGVGMLTPECPKCGTSVTAANETRFLDRTRKVLKWGTVPVWGPLYVVTVMLLWRIGVKKVGAFALDYGLRLAKIRSISAREREMLINQTAEAVAEKLVGERAITAGSVSLRPGVECQITCTGCAARRRCPRKVDGFMAAYLGMSVANPRMAELQLQGAPGVQLCPPSQLFETQGQVNEKTIYDVHDEQAAQRFIGKRVLIVTDMGEEHETTIDGYVAEGVDGNPARPWVCGPHICSSEQILRVL